MGDTMFTDALRERDLKELGINASVKVEGGPVR